jgi:hypothetical protein
VGGGKYHVASHRRIVATGKRLIYYFFIVQCLSGALYCGDFARIMRKAGFAQWWTVSSRPIVVGDAKITEMTKGITFFSETVRACKVSGLEDAPEDFGQTAVYNGNIPGFPHAFALGFEEVFITGQKTPVDGNTARVLKSTRYGTAFRVSEAKDHRGPFQRRGYPVFGISSMDSSSKSEGSSCCPPRKDASSSSTSEGVCCPPRKEAASCCEGEAASSCCPPRKDGSSGGKACC